MNGETNYKYERVEDPLRVGWWWCYPDKESEWYGRYPCGCVVQVRNFPEGQYSRKELYLVNIDGVIVTNGREMPGNMFGKWYGPLPRPEKHITDEIAEAMETLCWATAYRDRMKWEVREKRSSRSLGRPLLRTKKEIAQYLEKSERTISRYARQHVPLGVGPYTKDEIDEWFEQVREVKGSNKPRGRHAPKE